ncbi:AAA family ATPase, partial [Escherichia coli]|nr:AAA family ATPase [Escherichia coli]
MRLFTERRRRENDPGGHLAYSLARTGSKVLALDFDVRNALRL